MMEPIDSKESSKINIQVKHYCSHNNLSGDNFLKKNVADSENGMVSIALICTFSRMSGHLGLGDVMVDDISEETVKLVADTLRRSASLKISDDGKKVSRATELTNPDKVLACGGETVNSVYDLTENVLSGAGLVYDYVLGEGKHTIAEGVKNPHSCSILIKVPNDHTIAHIKDAVCHGLRAMINTIKDEAVILGVGAFEVAARQHFDLLNTEVKKTVKGRAQLGLRAFADALFVVPKTLAKNGGLYTQDVIIDLTGEHENANIVWLNLQTSESVSCNRAGAYRSMKMKRSRFIFKEISQKFPLMAFIVKSCDEKSARRALHEFINHDSLQPYQLLHEKSVGNENDFRRCEAREETVCESYDFCAICLKQLRIQEIALVKGCEHTYGLTCILGWTSCKENTTCPQCNHPFKSFIVRHALDGGISTYKQEESIGLLLKATWFKHLVKQSQETYGYADEDDVDEAYLRVFFLRKMRHLDLICFHAKITTCVLMLTLRTMSILRGAECYVCLIVVHVGLICN